MHAVPDGLDDRDVASLAEHRRRKQDEAATMQLHLPEPDAEFVCSSCGHVAESCAHLVVHLIAEHDPS